MSIVTAIAIFFQGTTYNKDVMPEDLRFLNCNY